MIDVFISYAREDIEIAKELFALLKKNGFRPWLDKENLLPGQDWASELESAVKGSDAQLFLCSPRSVNKRGFFQREIRIALESAKSLLDSDVSIIPYLVEPCDLPESLARYQWVDRSEPGSHFKMIKALALVAEQRGFFEETSEKKPVVVEYEASEKLELDRGFQSSVSVPKLRFPRDPDLSNLINAFLSGQAFQSLSEFRRANIDDQFALERSIPNEFHLTTEPEYLNEFVVSVVNYVWWYGGGAHGNSYRSSLNVDIADQGTFRVSDLFNSLDEIVEFVREEITRRGVDPLVEPDELGGTVKSSLDTKSYISSAGVRILFDPYEIFPYAFGNFDILLPSSHRAFSRSNLTALGIRLL
ncbi:TIR domain-containing protein [Roseobacter sinensis]|uniref:TIR domain-containing protein n=1 Tax=Roseobacter sinensis TaxID=2931391 RepID=A0ABT3BD65_9RHOB|nr:TIR domain-containing protein [Roseobacter sp. WL0113]MCV3271516.1 TIR domain-containing protein [Roseobacter sp. WL0113]